MLCVGVRYKMCPSNFSVITRITRILVIFLKKGNVRRRKTRSHVQFKLLLKCDPVVNTVKKYGLNCKLYGGL